ncbi:hypothetical protein [Actinophytocola sp.]|uniref:hypothetical protein n=1 Tax=Actinophytocola sp. TaxID=1872138 RepID=UPI002ED2B190
MKAVEATLIALSIVTLLAVGVVFYFFANLTPHPPPKPAGPVPERPADLTDAARQRLDAEGLALIPTLEEVRVSGDITPRAVADALIAFGYPDRDIEVEVKPAIDARSVVFGVTFEDGCLSGVVAPTEVRAGAMPEHPYSGCLPPDVRAHFQPN